MHASLQQSANSGVSLGKSHGYRFEGDTAILTAELALDGERQDASSSWALQLWACDEPYRGGQLRGIKVAEAELALAHALQQAQLETAASAQLPPAQREYAMVLVLASGAAGVYDQVHDFSNYPLRQGFTGPHLEGNVGYRFSDGSVVLQAERIRNPRPEGNLSGTLALELWALPAPYAGGSCSGVRLAQAELEPLAGQTHRAPVERLVPLHLPREGAWQLTLMLREWTAAFGYVTRDYCNFVQSYRVAETTKPELERTSADSLPEGALRSAAELRTEERWSSDVGSPALTGARVLADVPRTSADAPAMLGKTAEALLGGSSVESAPASSESALQERASVSVSGETKLGAAVVASATPAAADSGVTVALPAVEFDPSVVAPGAVVKLAAAVAKSAAADVMPAAAVERSAAEAQLADGSQRASRVSVQQASIDALAAVPGLNKKLAAAIVRGRPFKSLEELTRIRGIGDKILQRLRPYLTL